MTSGSRDVEAYLAALEHPFKEAVDSLRLAVLARDPARVSENVKWNAPSFRYDGEDRATMRLQPGNRMEVVLHRGAKVRTDAADFVFETDSGLLRWLGPDRALVTFPEPDGAMALVPEVAELVHAWMRASA